MGPEGTIFVSIQDREPGINADVLQYDYLNPGITLTSVLSTPVFRSYGLQLAPTVRSIISTRPPPEGLF